MIGVAIRQVFRQSLMVTSFVAVMMLAIEYLNVLTQGLVSRFVGASRPVQYTLAVFLGATPGCLGAYVLVALYTHGSISLGAVVAGMLATSGDEMFVMLAIVPRAAVAMTVGLMALGVMAGWITDMVLSPPAHGESCHNLEIHPDAACSCLPPWSRIVAEWRPPSAYRAVLTTSLALFLVALFLGELGPITWGWKRVTLAAIVSVGFFIVVTVPDHFLDDHLWHHVIREHVPRIFLWTFGVLAVVRGLDAVIDFKTLARGNPWLMLLLASVVGVIPESGPHLLFVSLYAQGAVPLSVLVASSAVQDGHGMLPLLAQSRRDFLRVKGINLLVGVGVGAVLLAFGY
ncbi:MAG: arsenic efflux protein [Deltaproteobacteria bacterium]|nr:arsenic efflux protein [Deltaproteobacteria bacterium]